MNSACGARWLASPEVIIQVLFTSEQPKRNKMASRFASISKKEILSMNKEAVPKNTKMETKFGIFNVSYLISPASYSKAKNQNTMPCLRKLLSTIKSQWKQWNIWCFSAWFQQQEEFKSTIEEMTPQQLIKCLQKFYLSARRREGTFHNKTSLTAIRAALDRHLRSLPLKKPFSIIGDSLFTIYSTCVVYTKTIIIHLSVGE